LWPAMYEVSLCMLSWKTMCVLFVELGNIAAYPATEVSFVGGRL